MKHKTEIAGALVILMFLSTAVNLLGSDAVTIFKKGNTYYTQGKIDSALSCYKKIVESGYESGQLYFNIGNCYYKLGDIARSILNYERAKKFIPRDDALNQNMELAKLRIVDKINPMPEFFLVKIIHKIIFAVSQKVLIIVSLLFYMIAAIFTIITIITQKRVVKKICRFGALLSSSIFLLSAVCLISQIRADKTDRKAVILTDKVDVMSAPSAEEGVEIFSIHSGTTVRIENIRGKWVEIVLADGKVGWMKKRDMEEVWP